MRQLCQIHPNVDYRHAWGCPDCVVELRTALAETQQELELRTSIYDKAMAKLEAAEQEREYWHAAATTRRQMYEYRYHQLKDANTQRDFALKALAEADTKLDDALAALREMIMLEESDDTIAPSKVRAIMAKAKELTSGEQR